MIEPGCMILADTFGYDSSGRWSVFDGGGALVPCIIFLGISAACVWGGFRARGRRRFILDIPLSKVMGVFVGMAEIEGDVEIVRPLRSRLAEVPCVYFAFTVEESWSRTVTETYTDEKGNTQTRTRTESGWTTVDSGGNFALFCVRDDTGALRVDPDGAEIKADLVLSEHCGRGDALYYAKGPRSAIADSDHHRRFTEYAIPVGAHVGVIGHARERADAIAAEIAYDDTAPMFMISTKPLERVASDCGWLGLFLLVAIPAVIIFAGVVCAVKEVPFPVGVAASVLAIHGTLVLLGWLWSLYNSLVALRNSVRQACAQVDVLLKLRADLIPNLVACVSGMKTYEAETQRALALLRGQHAATPPGVIGPDHDGIMGRVLASVEAYPEITADKSFSPLAKALSDCEARLALARGYYNSFATAYNDRIQVFLVNVFAGMAGFVSMKLWVAENLARRPVAVHFGEPAPGQGTEAASSVVSSMTSLTAE